MVIAEEALSAVRTVHAHCTQEFETLKYLDKLKLAQHLAVQRSTLSGTTFATFLYIVSSLNDVRPHLLIV